MQAPHSRVLHIMAPKTRILVVPGVPTARPPARSRVLSWTAPRTPSPPAATPHSRKRQLTAVPPLASRVRRAQRDLSAPVDLMAQPMESDVEMMESDATTSGAEGPMPNRPRSRALADKVRRRSKQVMEADTGLLSYLEWSAVKDDKRYRQARDCFLAFADLQAARLVADDEVDACIVLFFNQCFEEGRSPNFGDVTLAALLHFAPEFGRHGGRSLPRCLRALKGWRRRCPARSRLCHVFAMWAAVIWELCRAGEYRMGLMVLWMVVLYLRPSEALGIQRGDIQMPVKSIGKHAHFILFPEERPDRSKTYTANDSIELYCPWLHWFPTTVDVLREGSQEERIFPLTYSFFLTKWRAALKRCQLRMVPYEARHSGPSIDAAGLHRTRSEIQLRGRWAAESSVHRY